MWVFAGVVENSQVVQPTRHVARGLRPFVALFALAWMTFACQNDPHLVDAPKQQPHHERPDDSIEEDSATATTTPADTPNHPTDPFVLSASPHYAVKGLRLIEIPADVGSIRADPVEISWEASTAPSLSGYQLWRGHQALGAEPWDLEAERQWFVGWPGAPSTVVPSPSFGPILLPQGARVSLSHYVQLPKGVTQFVDHDRQLGTTYHYMVRARIMDDRGTTFDLQPSEVIAHQSKRCNQQPDWGSITNTNLQWVRTPLNSINEGIPLNVAQTSDGRVVVTSLEMEWPHHHTCGDPLPIVHATGHSYLLQQTFDQDGAVVDQSALLRWSRNERGTERPIRDWRQRRLGEDHWRSWVLFHQNVTQVVDAAASTISTPGDEHTWLVFDHALTSASLHTAPAAVALDGQWTALPDGGTLLARGCDWHGPCTGPLERRDAHHQLLWSYALEATDATVEPLSVAADNSAIALVRDRIAATETTDFSPIGRHQQYNNREMLIWIDQNGTQVGSVSFELDGYAPPSRVLFTNARRTILMVYGATRRSLPADATGAPLSDIEPTMLLVDMRHDTKETHYDVLTCAEICLAPRVSSIGDPIVLTSYPSGFGFADPQEHVQLTAVGGNVLQLVDAMTSEKQWIILHEDGTRTQIDAPDLHRHAVSDEDGLYVTFDQNLLLSPDTDSDRTFLAADPTDRPKTIVLKYGR